MRGLLLLLFLAGGTSAHPVPKAAQAPIVGTTWTGTYQWDNGSAAAMITIDFEAGGRAHFNVERYSCTWIQTGSDFHIDFEAGPVFVLKLQHHELNGTGTNGPCKATVNLKKHKR